MELNEEELKNAIKECKNISDFCRYLGKRPQGRNFYHVQEIIDEYHLDISHFVREPWNKGKSYIPHYGVRPMEDVLQNGTKIASSALKKRLFNNGYKEKKCECCGNTEWMGKPINLELHHINGNHNDNRLENLQILCPNCHSYTESYRGSNQARYSINEKAPSCKMLTEEEIKERHEERKVKKRVTGGKEIAHIPLEPQICPSCKKEFMPNYKGQIYCCSKCNQQDKYKKPSKEDLQKDIESIGYNLTKIGNKYDVSGNAVRKWMKSYDLYIKNCYQHSIGECVIQYDKDLNKVTEYRSISEAVRQTNLYALKRLSKEKEVIVNDYIFKIS